MHTYKLPKDVLDNWLEGYPSIDDNYGHLLLEQVGASDAALAAAFRPYFESAHLDARKHFHEEICIDLHPDAGAVGSHATYPKCLPTTARRGLFGEVMAGMLTEHYKYVGEHDWQIPVFLFRHHEDAKQYLFALAREPKLTRQMLGRHGSDFLAIALDAEGKVERYLAGEAKWRKKLGKAVVSSLLKDANGKGIWYQLSERDTNIPHGMRQLQKLLKEIDPQKFAAAIFSIDQALLLSGATPIARTNLVFICGNDFASRKSAQPIIEWKKKPKDYQSAHDLQVVEMILSGDGESLIDLIYESLWNGV